MQRWRKSAEQGYTKAQFNLEDMYANGEGVLEDDAKAVYWNRKAAKKGYARAQSSLGNMYYQGEGVLEDYVQAYAWWSIAATQGRKSAKNNKAITKEEMTPAQIAEAQKLSSEYWEKYVVPFQKD